MNPAHPTSFARTLQGYCIGRVSIFVIAWMMGCTGFALADADADEDGGAAVPRMSDLMCGPNSLYFLLRLYGLTPSFEAIVKQMPPGDRGVSLADLAIASNSFGLPAEPRCLEMNELLHRHPTPFIAYCESGGADIGHFVVVMGVNNNAIFLVDGSSFQLLIFSIDQFAAQWKGYALIPSVGKQGLIDRRAIVCLIISGFFWISFSGVMATRHWGKVRRIEALPAVVKLISAEA